MLEAFEGKIPSSLTDLLGGYTAITTQLPQNPAEELSRPFHWLSMLDASFQSLPTEADSDRPKQYVAKTPFPTPAYYPQNPLSQFENPAVFEKFDTDTLFFIFYHQQGTYHQYAVTVFFTFMTCLLNFPFHICSGIWRPRS